MSNTITNIEGIGNVYATKLKEAGIRSVSGLLKKCATKAGRKVVANQTGLDEALILKWTNMADLYRVRGVGCEYSELLEKAGVDTVKELKNRVPQNLHAKLVEVNTEKNLVRTLPSLKRVEAFIEHANKLEAVVSY
jgi:predicted flap endonuclease-1-like 5' DNA nuclease